MADARRLAALAVSMEVRLWSGDREIAVGLRQDGDATVAEVAGAAHRLRVASPGPRATIAGATVEEVDFEDAGRPVRAVVEIGRAHV